MMIPSRPEIPESVVKSRTAVRAQDGETGRAWRAPARRAPGVPVHGQYPPFPAEQRCQRHRESARA